MLSKLLFRRTRTADAPRALRCGVVVTSLGPGGLEEAVAMVASGLRAQGIETSVLCTHAGGVTAERLAASGISVTVADGSPRKWRAWARRFRPDVLSTHFVSLRAAKVLSKWAPYVETIQNTNVWLSPDEWAEERKKCAAAAALIPVSEMVAAYEQRICGRHTSVTVIPNGVQGDRVIGVSRQEARRQLDLGADDIVLVHLARFCIQKNQPGLVTALAQLLDEDPRIRLLLVGGQADRDYVAQVVSSAGGLLARGAVRLLPHTVDVGVVLSAADAFVSNSFFEGWSLAATEALWLGRPVILSDCGGSRELIGENGERGILIPNPGGDPLTLEWRNVASPDAARTAENHEALRHAVRAFVLEKEAWAARTDVIQREARALWSAERMVAAYAEVLRNASQR